ncbi:MAG: class I adenylate-forming enzyme family protein [Hellea sp.]
MSVTDPITAALMAEGGPFEVVTQDVRGKSLRVFKNAPETLTDIIDGARQHGEAEFLVSGSRRLTFDGFFEQADGFAARLVHDFGVTPGQSVAICMKNSPEWMMSFVGILRAGGVVILVNSRGTAKTMLEAVEDTDSVLVLTDKKRHELLAGIGCKALLVNMAEMGDLRSEHPTPSVKRGADELAAMFFTSGTTGSAKAAAMSHRALVTGVMNGQMAMVAIFQKMAAAYNIDVETLKSQMPQSCSLLVFPLFHTSGCSSIFLTTLINGGKIVIMERWSAEGALKLMQEERVTILGGVPATHWDLLTYDGLDDYDLSSLVSISSGGQAFPRNLMSALRERFPKAYIGAGYGMTETSGSVSQANGEALWSRLEASGTILPMMDVRISGDNGEALELGQTGEIWVKGAALMTEYYGRPDDTNAAFSGDWFKTGDVGFIDEDDYIYIVDRKTDMVISGGENIYCVEVEAAISKHPDVLQICTFGIPDDRLGEKLIACYVPQNRDLSPEDMKQFANEKLAAYRVPKQFICVMEPFKLNAMSKVEKRKIRESFLAGEYS